MNPDDTAIDTPEGEIEQEVAKPASQKDDVIPKHQFLAAIASANQKYEKLERELTELKAAQAKPEQQQYSRAQLQQLVEDGKITQTDSDNLWEHSIRERTKREVLTEFGSRSEAQQQDAIVAAELREYSELVPAVLVEGSDERRKVEREFHRLVKLGLPQTKATEVAALRTALGDTESLKSAKNVRRGPADAHVETGGSNPGGGGEKDPVKQMDARLRAFYQKGIDQGRYKDWSAVRDELKYARKRG